MGDPDSGITTELNGATATLDGTGSSDSLPGLRDKLDVMATALIAAVNEAHWDRPGPPGTWPWQPRRHGRRSTASRSNEERVDLVRHQRQLETARRVMTAVDQALDTLVNRLSDAPAQTSRGPSLHPSLSSHDEELRAANDARSLAQGADGELQGATNMLQRIRELTVSAATVGSGDVDIAEAKMDLQVEGVAYQATLQALGRSLPDTLVSFLC